MTDVVQTPLKRKWPKLITLDTVEEREISWL
jgi:hypothetical protein